MASYTFDDTFNEYNKNSNKDDGNISLSYSVASGESTDSSFAGILRVLDKQDNKDLNFVLKKEGLRKHPSGNSLAGYSTDGESHLAGTHLLQTIAGQPSSEVEAGGRYNIHDEEVDTGLMFHLPKQPNLKRRSKTPETSPSSSVDTPTRSPHDMTPKNLDQNQREEESWYNQCTKCFPDALDFVLPDKR